jgi:hypothetical protein
MGADVFHILNYRFFLCRALDGPCTSSQIADDGKNTSCLVLHVSSSVNAPCDVGCGGAEWLVLSVRTSRVGQLELWVVGDL